MPERCLGRIIRRNKEAIAHFTNGSRFYLESRCSYTVSQGEICARCQGWKENGMNKKDIYGNYFGLVTEPLPSDCHIFESDWYASKVKEYGYPSEFEMARAKQSQQEARGSAAVAAVKEVKEVKTEEKQKPKRQYKKKEQTAVVVTEPVAEPIVEKPKGTVGKRRPKNALPAEAPAPVPVVTVSEEKPQDEKPQDEKPKEEKPKEEKPKAKRQYKKKEPVITVTPVVSSKVEVQAVEGKPFESELEIIKIVVKPFTHNDVAYFRDSTKNKLYSVGKDKRPSTYIGRWDPDTETINTDFPDSDAE